MTNEHSTALAAACAERDARRATHAKAVADLTAARADVESTQAELERLEGHEREWVERDSRRRAAARVAGKAQPPALVADAKVALAQASARANARAAVLECTALETVEREARAQLERCEAAVQQAERAIDVTLVRALAERRTALLRELFEIVDLVAVCELDHPGTVPVDIAAAFNGQLLVPTAELALQRSRHIVHSIDTPIGERSSAIEAARARWQRLRTEAQAAQPLPAAQVA
jgi:hypothetical protein